jgi:hypothetical protein
LTSVKCEGRTRDMSDPKASAEQYVSTPRRKKARAAKQHERFQIETGVHVPQSRSNLGQTKYPFPYMKLGDSFVAQVRDTSMRRSWKHWAKTTASPFRFIVRGMVGDRCRVWRVK